MYINHEGELLMKKTVILLLAFILAASVSAEEWAVIGARAVGMGTNQPNTVFYRALPGCGKSHYRRSASHDVVMVVRLQVPFFAFIQGIESGTVQPGYHVLYSVVRCRGSVEELKQRSDQVVVHHMFNY